MKVFATLLAGLTAVYAQGVTIGIPLPQAQLTPGKRTVVQIVRPNFLSSSQEVSVVIGISPCFSGFCRDPSDTMGQILYSGGYNPQSHPNTGQSQWYQNFTVTLPSSLPQGQAVVGVAHFALIGASLQPWIETKSVTVNIQ